MSSLPPNLQSAVDAYRERVLNDNVAIISTLVAKLEHEAIKAKRSNTETQEAVLRTLCRECLRRDLPSSPNISSARDLLEVDNRPLLAEHFGLDGIARRNIDIEKRQRWLASVQNDLAELREKSDRTDLEGNWPAALPSELQSLMESVDLILQPGLPYRRVRWGIECIIPDMETTSGPMTFIPTGDMYNDILFDVWHDWGVRVAVELVHASMNPSCMLALFCKNGHDSRGWAWRYGIFAEEWYSELFDDMETFLRWFATYEVQTEEAVNRELFTINWGWPPYHNVWIGDTYIP